MSGYATGDIKQQISQRIRNKNDQHSCCCFHCWLQVPDIYDSSKYDTLHNAHLGLGATLEELYREAKVLADAVIPNE